MSYIKRNLENMVNQVIKEYPVGSCYRIETGGQDYDAAEVKFL